MSTWTWDRDSDEDPVEVDLRTEIVMELDEAIGFLYRAQQVALKYTPAQIGGWRTDRKLTTEQKHEIAEAEYMEHTAHLQCLAHGFSGEEIMHARTYGTRPPGR